MPGTPKLIYKPIKILWFTTPQFLISITVPRKTKENLCRFVDIINSLNKDRENDCFTIKIKQEVESIIIKGKTYYYYKAYWIERKEEALDSSDTETVLDIEQCIKTIANIVLSCNNIDDLNNIHKRLAILSEIVLNKIDNIKQLAVYT